MRCPKGRYGEWFWGARRLGMWWGVGGTSGRRGRRRVRVKGEDVGCEGKDMCS